MMKIIISAAVSADGYIDDAGDSRLVLSSPEDLEAVRALRKSCDAILVGANTVRRDNPALAETPIRITITASGNLPRQAQFFRDDGKQKLVYAPPEALEELEETIGKAASLIATTSLREMLADLEKRGIKKLLVEGGTNVLTQFLSLGLADELRLAVAPFFVGDARAPRFVNPALFPQNSKNRMILERTETLGDTAVLHYRLERR